MKQKPNSIIFCGDLCLSGSEIQYQLVTKPLNPWESIFNESINTAAVIANLECSITDSDTGRPFKWANLKMSPKLHGLIDGLSMVVLGNNHVGDFGDEGISNTIEILENKGIAHVGLGSTIEEAIKPSFVELDNGRLGIVSLCCPTTNSEFLAGHQTPGVAPLGMATLRQSIERAHNLCDALVAYLHWGCEGVHDPAPDQLRLARFAIDCGADAVIGCHPHVIQSYEQYRGRWIFYSLGNFLFNAGEGQSFSADGACERIPISLRPENRESLVVAFCINEEDKGLGRLRLESIIPIYYGKNWVPQQIKLKELTFDLKSANQRLIDYSSRNRRALQSREEPQYTAKLRNGVLAFWYVNESIKKIPIYSSFIKKIQREFEGDLSVLLKIKKLPNYSLELSRKLLLNARIKIKWRRDCSQLPLKTEHRLLYDIIHRHYWHELGDFPNLVAPRDFNDRIQWLKLFDQDNEIVRCSDKLKVREYIQERVGEKYLVKLFQVCNHFDEIDFNSLPNEFVIKTNHDSGTVITVHDKLSIDRQWAKKKIEASLIEPYGWEKGEWAYAYVEPKVLVEELIESKTPSCPNDYKFYVVNGQVKFCHFISERDKQPKEQTVSPSGKDLKTELYPSFKLASDFKKPSLWNEMIDVAEKIGRDFKCVRVDLYCELERIYAGEMTFWPMAGCYKGDGQKKLGKLLDFDRSTVKPFLLHRLKNK